MQNNITEHRILETRQSGQRDLGGQIPLPRRSPPLCGGLKGKQETGRRVTIVIGSSTGNQSAVRGRGRWPQVAYPGAVGRCGFWTTRLCRRSVLSRGASLAPRANFIQQRWAEESDECLIWQSVAGAKSRGGAGQKERKANRTQHKRGASAGQAKPSQRQWAGERSSRKGTPGSGLQGRVKAPLSGE